MLTVVLIALVLLVLMFAVIALDECRTLKRRLDTLEDQVSEIQDDQVAHEKTHDQDREREYLRSRISHPTAARRRTLVALREQLSRPVEGGES